MADFERLWSEHRHVTAFVRRRGAPPEAVEDVVSEVYLVAWRRLHRVPHEPDEVRAWLCTVARNVLANVRRHQARQTDLNDRLVAAAWPGRAASGAETAGRWLAAEAFRSLGAGDQRLLWLAGTRPLNTAELGRALGCSPGTVAVRLSRARRRLDRAAADG